MTTYVPPKNAAGYILYTGLIDQSNTKVLKANPTLATGDFKVSIDGGAFANLGTTPTVTPAAGTSVKITLSGAEMTGDNIQIACIDAAGAEWCDQFINIQTAARQIDDLSFPATSGRSTNVSAGGVVDADMVKINTDATSAANLAKTTRDLLRGTVVTAGSSTTLIATGAFDVVGIATDQFKGRIVTFDYNTTTTALRGQATDITSSTIATAPVFTVTALTTTPQTGDTFTVS